MNLDKMAAPKDNKHNLVWTLEKAQAFLDEIYSYVKLNKDCNSLVKAAVECGEYETLIYYIKDNVNNIEFEPIKRAKDIIKARLIDNGLSATSNVAMTIFTLKNNHDMKDKSEVDQNTSITWNEETYPINETDL